MNGHSDGLDAQWFKAVDQQLRGIHEKPVIAFEHVFGELNRCRSRFEGAHRRAVESLWAAAVAYLTLDLSRGDELRLQAARCLRDRH